MATATPSTRPLKVGLFFRMHEDMTTRVTPGWHELCEIAHRAEEIGVDSLWFPDHLMVRFPPDDVYDIWECWTMLSAVAATTSRVEIGTLVTCTNFRNPALVAKMAATVDEIGGGRFTLGLGAGWHEADFTAFGIPFDKRVDRFEESLTIIKALLRDGKVDFEGEYYQARECELRPRGPRPSGLPILIGATGPRMMRLAARHADIWNRDVGPEGTVAELPGWQVKVDTACAEVGREAATLARYAAFGMHLPGSAPPNEASSDVSGTYEELADVLHAYAAAGISHVQLFLEPFSLSAMEDVAHVLEILDTPAA